MGYIKVNKLDSVLTQLPYDYYQLPFCQPYNADPDELGQQQQETGWKLVHRDVFRTPNNPLFSCVIGTGVQVRPFAHSLIYKYTVNINRYLACVY